MERALAAAVCAGVSVLGACAASREPVTVAVRDAQSKEPLVGAVVVADTPNRNHPFSIASILGQAGPTSARGTTDAQGRAVLTGIDERPVRIGVFAPDREPAFGLFDRPSGSDWAELGGLDQTVGRGVEARIEREAPARATARRD